VSNISNEIIDLLKLFNLKADSAINSKFKKESKENKFGETLEWKHNDETNELDFNYSVKNQDQDFINSVLLPLRLFFFLKKEPISIRKLSDIYEKMPIAEKYKIIFRNIRTELNLFLDEPAKTLLDDKPTRRDLLHTIINGEMFHLSKREREVYEKWKSDNVVWDLAYVEFQRIIHECIDAIQIIKNLNTRIMKDYGLN